MLIFIAELALNWNGRIAEFVANKRKDEKTSKQSSSSNNAGQVIQKQSSVSDFDSHSISSTVVSVSRQTSVIDGSCLSARNAESRITRSASGIMDDSSTCDSDHTRPPSPTRIETAEAADSDLKKDHQQVGQSSLF